ncbi:MAG TPA: Shedu anti-phage system protein SduA domain-containing protein [Candidatus Saccharimonadales bacterium]|nr:Shedu anti-phage system protein SduA domain-containing protein [Candidatus Saccharimonadales bacterium]
MKSLVKGLTSALAHSDTERPVCAWLKRNPLIISHGLGGFPRYVVAEFPFGSEFRADFVRLCPSSGAWDIDFVELEPPGSDLFTRQGVPAKRLNSAMAQVDTWRAFIETNRPSVLRDLSRFVQKKELVFRHRDHEPANDVGQTLYDPKSWVRWSYFIVIGRRKLLSDDELRKKAAFLDHHNIVVLTYDRLLDAAKNHDAIERQKTERQCRAKGREPVKPAKTHALRGAVLRKPG